MIVFFVDKNSDPVIPDRLVSGS